jgi:hypothetical protein
MSDVKAKFEAALAQRKKQKAEEASRGNFSGGQGFPDIPYAPLYTDKQQVFRFVGLPYLVREKHTDSKRIHIAMILGDDDKKFRCIGPDPQEQKDWFLYRVMNKVLTRHWDKNVPGFGGQLGAYVYDYATIHPELYNRVAKNNNVENVIEKGWRFSPYMLFNVIDRANYAWHQENKKFRVLSKKASEYQDKVFFEPGVPDTLFQLIMDDIVAIDGNTNWEDYDIVIRKVTDKPWYKVYHGIDDIKKIDDDVKPLIVNGGISDVERSWELNNFDAIFPVTRYSRIKSKLGIFIQKVDLTFKTKYYDELALLVEKEEAELAEKQMNTPAADEETAVPDWVHPEHPVPPTPVTTALQQPSAVSQAAYQQLTAAQPAAPQPSAVVQQTPAQAASHSVRSGAAAKAYAPVTDAIWAGLVDGSYNGKKYLGVPKMTSEEKALVLGVHADGSFEWRPDAGELFKGHQSLFLAPGSVHVDPLDGTEFKD